MKRVIIIFLLAIITGLILSQTIIKPKHIHIHAGFQVYLDGKLQDFSDFKYMHEKPCTIDGKPLEGARTDEQLEKAHLHDQTGDIVHSHRDNAVWRDLFINLKYPIDKDAVVYINREKVEDFLSKKIKPYESAVIFLGKHTDDLKVLKNALKKDYILKIEKKSETCSL